LTKPALIHLLIAALIATGVPASAPQAQVRLPSLGDGLSEDFGTGSERRLGERIMREVRRDPAYLDDPIVLDYVQSLWAPLIRAAQARGDIAADTESAFAWEVFLVRDRSVNAFALPGGFIGVHLGLIAMTTARDELASVMAHELAHVTQRHIARGMSNSQQQSILGLAAIILGMLAASRAGSADAMQAVVVGGQAAVVQGQLNYSRDMEREADRVGWGMFIDAGFAPSGMASMFEKLDQAARLVDNNAFPYLRTHPLTTERIGEARARLEGSGAPDTPPANVFEHSLIRVRSRVLMDTRVEALRRAQDMQAAADAAPAERLAVLYGNALASLMLREPARADRALADARQLLRTSPLREAQDRRAERVLALLQAEVMVANGDPAGALALLDAEAAGGRPWMLQRAQTALALARAGGTSEPLRRSVEALQTRVAEQRDDALAWSTLAQGTAQLGQPLRSVRAEAEARAAAGDLVGAIDRLRAGQRLARTEGSGDYIELSVIDARLRQLEAEYRRRVAEMRSGGG
jgi:predicted Zn-dependent protease